MATSTIRDFYNRIIGYIDEDSNGNKTARDFYRVILGRYDKNANVTKDFGGRIIARGDMTSGLIYEAEANSTRGK